MATTTADRPRAGDASPVTAGRRASTETKHSSKSTELYAYVVVLAGLLIAGLLTKAGDGHDDRFQAHQVWLYATILTVGYMVARGLAKSGSRDPYTADDDRR